MWPKIAEYFVDEAAEASGIAAVDVLNAIRKAKSERAVSIKFPITHAFVAAAGEGAYWATLAPVAADAASAGNVLALEWSEAPGPPPSPVTAALMHSHSPLPKQQKLRKFNVLVNSCFLHSFLGGI